MLFVCLQKGTEPDRTARSAPAGWLVGVDIMLTAEELEQLLEVNCSVKQSEEDDEEPDQEEPCQS